MNRFSHDIAHMELEEASDKGFILWLSMFEPRHDKTKAFNRKTKFSRKKNNNNHSKMFFSEAKWGKKLKLCIHVHDSSLYINYVLYCCCPCAFVAIATYVSLGL